MGHDDNNYTRRPDWKIIINCWAIKIKLLWWSPVYPPPVLLLQWLSIISKYLSSLDNTVSSPVTFPKSFLCSRLQFQWCWWLKNWTGLHFWQQIKIECLNVSRHIPMLNRPKITGDTRPNHVMVPRRIRSFWSAVTHSLIWSLSGLLSGSSIV